ncbi:SMI1/KNR4 family protein [Streptomyces griseorubiginosus]|uniref:SMI1/KNR4 family protein n=1 Tax=Streptomyces griseorubiginosus TaxID=67304 RepID=UPI0036CF7E6E
MAADFERRHGYPPGTNELRPAAPDDRPATRTLLRSGLAYPDLITFYDSIAEVTWPDVGIGYFVDPVQDVLLRFKEYGAGEDEDDRSLVIGSNGSGQCYVTGPSGAIYRTRTATLHEPELTKVADDLRQFLELLEESLTRFVGDGGSGRL